MKSGSVSWWPRPAYSINGGRRSRDGHLNSVQSSCAGEHTIEAGSGRPGRMLRWPATKSCARTRHIWRDDMLPEPLGTLSLLDEAQRIKNRNETSETAKRIPRRRSWALTGTPIENDEEELASILEFVDHDEGGPRKRYAPGAALQLRHRELQLRRRKGDVLQDLPPKLETGWRFRCTGVRERATTGGTRWSRPFEVTWCRCRSAACSELITRLKQICNADPKTGASSKLDDIGDRLRKLADQGHKALIFSQYTSDVSGVAAAANHLQEFNPLTLTGETPQDRRLDLINQFKTGDSHKALIVSLRAGGLGLNLQEASYVFHLDRWWNPAVERQAEDRSHRLGQTVKVNVIKYTCINTIEERIDRILRRSRACSTNWWMMCRWTFRRE